MIALTTTIWSALGLVLLFIITDIQAANWVQYIEPKLFVEQGVIGAVDGTHVAIVPPTEAQHEHLYVNRKGYHSKNVTIVCDSDLKIMYLNARHPGSTHDSFIWRTTSVRAHLERKYLLGQQNGWLLGDSGYPREPWLMLPILDALPDSPERRYTTAHCSARSAVERCIGVLKGRFRCLRKERALHYNPTYAGHIINACAVLHNLAIDNNIALPAEEVYVEDYNVVPDGAARHRLIAEADNVRRNIVRQYFA